MSAQPRIPRSILLTLLVIPLGFLFAVWIWQNPQDAEQDLQNAEQETVQDAEIERYTPPPSDYVGSKACSSCHQEIADLYASHAMAKSTSRISEASPKEEYAPASSSFTAGTRQYQVEKQADRVLHHEILANTTGDVLYDQAVEVHYTMGSGAKARSYLIDRGGLLFMSPISWFAARDGWDLSPGYDPRYHRRFERRVNDACLACHVGRMATVSRTQPDRYQQQAFFEMSIGCENCHGPGKRHVDLYESVDDDAIVGDPFIVNPEKLSPKRRDAVCYQCHLGGAARIPRPGRSENDFRPGQLIEDIWTVFVESKSSEPDSASTFLGHAEQMQSSACYRGSDGQLGCISCHNSHHEPRPEKRVEFYRNRCNQCHQEHGCSLPLAERTKPPKSNSCIDCHMPEIPSSNIAHVSLTDHRVLIDPKLDPIKAPEALSPMAARGLASLRVFDEADKRMSEWEFQRARGLALWEIATAGRRENLHESRRLLTAILPKVPDDAEVLYALGMNHFHRKEPDLSQSYLQKALKARPHHEGALRILGLISFRNRKYDEGLDYYRRYLKLNPWVGVAYGPYSEMLEATGDLDQAIEMAERGLELDPTNPEMRKALARFYQKAGHEEKSRKQLELLREIGRGLSP